MAGEWYTTFNAWDTLTCDEPVWYKFNAISAKVDELYNNKLLVKKKFNLKGDKLQKYLHVN